MTSRWSCIIDIFCFVFFLNWACCFPATSEDRNSKHQYASSWTKTCYISPSFSPVSTGLFSAEMSFSPVALDVQIGSVFCNSPQKVVSWPRLLLVLFIFTPKLFLTLFIYWLGVHLYIHVGSSSSFGQPSTFPFYVGIPAGGVFVVLKIQHSFQLFLLLVSLQLEGETVLLGREVLLGQIEISSAYRILGLSY